MRSEEAREKSTTGPDRSGPPRRVRVTAPRRTVRARVSVPPLATEIDEQTRLGEVYVDALVRRSLRLALVILGAVGLLIGALLALFLFVPEMQTAVITGVPVAWLVLGVLPYPVFVLAAHVYRRAVEGAETDFATLVARDRR